MEDDIPSQPQAGWLARHWGGRTLELKVMKSAAGYYLGTEDTDGSPYSRESEEYWRRREEAQAALTSPVPGKWTQRRAP